MTNAKREFKIGDKVTTTEHVGLGVGTYKGVTAKDLYYKVDFTESCYSRPRIWCINKDKLFHYEEPVIDSISALETELDTVARDFINTLGNLCCETTEPTKVTPHGGPQSYYDMPFDSWVTTNDMMEYLAEHKWGKFGIHLKDIFKGLCRWGDKSGTTIEYDTRKIIYYGCRVLMMVVGVKALRTYLHELLDDKQFSERDTNDT